MKLAETYSMSGPSRVEISGWDMDELFFVEKAEVDWDESAENIRIRMNRPLRKGTLIFLRQIQPVMSGQTHPVAYSVEPVCADESGACEYQLKPLRSRMRSYTLEEAKGIH
ncbi:MAG: hypothetical protein LAN71_04825 [Acidobacteriia bacterium]|nr:hypothetical protein [Terriglobia bacterium]